MMLLVDAVASGFGELAGLLDDRVLDGDELRCVRLALGADEDVARIVAAATNPRPMADGADPSRLSHADIFTRRRSAGR